MKKIITLTICFSFIALLFPPPIFSVSGTSNVVCTKIGDPALGIPEECQAGSAGPIAQKAIELARAQIGKPYIWATPSRSWTTPNPGSFDCSGLTGWVWYQASNGAINMDGQTSGDWNDSAGKKGTKYQKFTSGNPQPGDLLFWTNGNIHHTAIFVGQCQKFSGNDCFIHAPRTGSTVQEAQLSKRSERLAGYLRPILQ